MRGSVAHMWQTCTPVDGAMLDEDIQTLDRWAQQVGLVAVYVATVDPCGLGCQTPAAASPAIAGQYRQRTFRVGGALRMV